MYIRYHIFTDTHHKYTTNFQEAENIYDDFLNDCGLARLYEQIFPSLPQDNSTLIDEHCILSDGYFPNDPTPPMIGNLTHI